MSDPDVIEELFGSAPWHALVGAFENEIDDALWALRKALGDPVYSSIQTADGRVSEGRAAVLLRTIYNRKRDMSLADAFRSYALGSTSLHHLLTPESKLRARKRPNKRDIPTIMCVLSVQLHRGLALSRLTSIMGLTGSGKSQVKIS
jgi:hypothetical protein